MSIVYNKTVLCGVCVLYFCYQAKAFLCKQTAIERQIDEPNVVVHIHKGTGVKQQEGNTHTHIHTNQTLLPVSRQRRRINSKVEGVNQEV